MSIKRNTAYWFVGYFCLEIEKYESVGKLFQFRGGSCVCTEGVIYKPGKQYAGKHRRCASNGITNLNLLKTRVEMPKSLR